MGANLGRKRKEPLAFIGGTNFGEKNASTILQVKNILGVFVSPNHLSTI